MISENESRVKVVGATVYEFEHVRDGCTRVTKFFETCTRASVNGQRYIVITVRDHALMQPRCNSARVIHLTHIDLVPLERKQRCVTGLHACIRNCNSRKLHKHRAKHNCSNFLFSVTHCRYPVHAFVEQVISVVILPTKPSSASSKSSM